MWPKKKKKKNHPKRERTLQAERAWFALTRTARSHSGVIQETMCTCAASFYFCFRKRGNVEKIAIVTTRTYTHLHI